MDIDIDFQTTFEPETIFQTATRASRVQNGYLLKHPAGIYFQNIGQDSITKLSAIPYKQAEQLGYTKIDFLHLSILNSFSSKQQIKEILKLPPNWSLLHDEHVVSQLFQIHKHFEIVHRLNPQSVSDLADCIAIIRPGKRYLLEYYLKNKQAVKPMLYVPTENGAHYYKKSHAVAYALTITLQMFLIENNITT